MKGDGKALSSDGEVFNGHSEELHIDEKDQWGRR